MALVLLIVGLLAATFLPATNTMLDNSRRKDTREKMDGLRQALTRFVVVNRRLPCPANGALPAGDPAQGLEQPQPGTAACTPAALTNGVLPWRTLGLSQDEVTDAWNTMITYRVWAGAPVSASSLTQADGMNLSSLDPATQSVQLQTFLQSRGFRVCSATPCAAGSAAESSSRTGMTSSAYVLISHGGNRVGGFSTDGIYLATANGAGPGPLEGINFNAVAPRTATPTDFYVETAYNENPAAYFDDIVLRPTVMTVAQEANLGPRQAP